VTALDGKPKMKRKKRRRAPVAVDRTRPPNEAAIAAIAGIKEALQITDRRWPWALQDGSKLSERGWARRNFKLKRPCHTG
jgi:hypothetical protein